MNGLTLSSAGGASCEVESSSRTLDTFEQFKIPLAAHAGGAEQVLDDENGNRAVCGNNERASGAHFNVDAMVSGLAIKPKSLLFEDADELLIGDWPERGHRLHDAHGEAID
jgi:hypothetical protein